MGEKILGWFEKIITGEKRRWFFAILIIIAILTIVVFPYIDANFLYYNRIEKRIENLSRLVALTNTPLDETHVLYPEYISILDEMETARGNSLFSTQKVEDTQQDRLWKFGGGALIWVLVAFVLLFQKKKGEHRTLKQWLNNLASAIICLGIGAFLGWLFLFVPTIGNSKLNFILAPVVQLVVLWLIIETPKSKKAKAHSEEPNT